MRNYFLRYIGGILLKDLQISSGDGISDVVSVTLTIPGIGSTPWISYNKDINRAFGVFWICGVSYVTIPPKDKTTSKDI